MGTAETGLGGAWCLQSVIVVCVRRRERSLKGILRKAHSRRPAWWNDTATPLPSLGKFPSGQLTRDKQINSPGLISTRLSRVFVICFTVSGTYSPRQTQINPLANNLN